MGVWRGGGGDQFSLSIYQEIYAVTLKFDRGHRDWYESVKVNMSYIMQSSKDLTS